MAMAAAKFWTVEELDQLPDDGNKYEVIDGELFVTPAPAQGHEHVIARLTALLVPVVVAHGLGMVFPGRPVVRAPGSSVEPDLIVRQPVDDPNQPWEQAPLPTLVVEVQSPSTRRRDKLQKRDFYLRCGIPEYWMIDPDARCITQVRPGMPDVIAVDSITWRPAGTTVELTFDVAQVFGRK
jgi:Uma2 family endonuclease